MEVLVERPRKRWVGPGTRLGPARQARRSPAGWIYYAGVTWNAEMVVKQMPPMVHVAPVSAKS